MIRLTFIVLVTGLITLEAQAQTSPKNSPTKATSKQSSAKANDWGWDAPASTKAGKNTSSGTTETAPASTTTDAANPTESSSAGATAGGFGGFGGGSSSADRNEGMSVAPGRPLLPASRTRSDYMGRPIKSKPSMRPRSVDYEKVDLLNATPAQ